MTTVERRNNERLSLELPVMVSVLNEEKKQKPFEFYSRDISASGVFLITDHPLKVGTDVHMDIVLSFLKGAKDKQKTHIDISGNVVRTENSGMAVCFDKQYTISPYKL